MIALVAAFCWLLAGVLVALRLPWRDVAFHAPWSRMRTDATGAPTSRSADVAFALCTVLLWPVAWRWPAILRANLAELARRERETRKELDAGAPPPA